jgi:hypothetical protein
VREKEVTSGEAFNLWQGLTPKGFKTKRGLIGNAPVCAGRTDCQRDGGWECIYVDYFKALDWDPETGKPSRSKLKELRQEDVPQDL